MDYKDLCKEDLCKNLTTLYYSRVKIYVRNKDGFVHGASLSRAIKQDFCKWRKRSWATPIFRSVARKVLNYSPDMDDTYISSKLVHRVNSTPRGLNGLWIHPLLAIEFCKYVGHCPGVWAQKMLAQHIQTVVDEKEPCSVEELIDDLEPEVEPEIIEVTEYSSFSTKVDYVISTVKDTKFFKQLPKVDKIIYVQKLLEVI